MPVAYVFARFDFPGRARARALAIVPFVLPTVVVASAFLALLGPRSPLNALASRRSASRRPSASTDVWAIVLAASSTTWPS